MKRILIAVAILAAVGAGLTTAANATPPTECEPFARYSYTPHGDPVDSTPLTDPEHWQVDHKKYDDSPTGVLIHQGEGNGSYFFWVANDCPDPEPSVTPDPSITPEPSITPDPDPSVTPDPDDEDPDPTFVPTCTTVTGSQTIVGNGIIAVDGGWASASIAVPAPTTLAGIGTVLNIEATPLQYVGLHIDTAEGTIVFEEEGSYAGNLWSNDAWDGVEAGMGYAAFGSIEEYIELNGDVAVTGIRLLYTHPEASSTTVTEFTIGCTTYTFVEPTDEEPEPSPEPEPKPEPKPTPDDGAPAPSAARGNPSYTG